MFYDFAFSLPVTATATNLKIVEFGITAGILKKVDILFPDGCCGVAKIAIFRFDHQIFPTNAGEFFGSNNEVITFPESLEIRDRPFIITLKGYNDGGSYSHNVHVRMYIENFEKSIDFFTGGYENQKLLESIR